MIELFVSLEFFKMGDRKIVKKIDDLKQIKGDAYDYYISGGEDVDLFEKKDQEKRRIRYICPNLIILIVFAQFH